MNQTPSLRMGSGWAGPALGLLLLGLLLVLFRDTAIAMTTIWWRSETFTHAFLVPPIVCWLVWRRRHALAATPQRPMAWMLLPMAAVCLLWLLGEMAAVNAATQFALVTLIVLSVPALFGMAVTRQILFPLAFLFFAVPVGEFLVPPMMDRTADFTVLALRASGIPVFREGLQFVIPSGSWSVIEACSGVRYLIASFMVGTLFAYLNYQSTTRRLVFVLFSLAVPIVANWIRAYMIVMLAHLSGNKLAAGVDHLIYGWVFFGIVILIMFIVGARWAEPEAPDAAPPAGGHQGRSSSAPAMAGVMLAITALLVGTQALAWRLDRADGLTQPRLELPSGDVVDAASAAGALTEWEPAFANPSATAQAVHRATTGAPVRVWVGYYRGQGYDRKLVTSTNTLVAGDRPSWAQTGSATVSIETASGPLALRSAELRASSLMSGQEARRLRVWQVYWIGGQFIAGDSRARLQTAVNRLFGRGDDGAVVLLATPLDTGVDADADTVLRTFAPGYLDRLAGQLAKTRDSR